MPDWNIFGITFETPLATLFGTIWRQLCNTIEKVPLNTTDQQTYMNSCEFDIMHNIVFAGVGQLLNLGEGPRSNLSYHVSNFKATTLPYFFRIPHLKGILGLIQWLEPYPHHIQIHCQHHYHHHPYPLQLCVSCPLVSRRKCTSIYVSRGLSRLGILTLIITKMIIIMVTIFIRLLFNTGYHIVRSQLTCLWMSSIQKQVSRWAWHIWFMIYVSRELSRLGIVTLIIDMMKITIIMANVINDLIFNTGYHQGGGLSIVMTWIIVLGILEK